MLELADAALGQLVQNGRVAVTYWNGTTKHYVGRQGQDMPELRVEIRSPHVVWRALANVSLALGEGYMDGHVRIDEEQLPLLFELIARNQSPGVRRQPARRASSRRRAQRGNIATHYDVGNDYYDLFLDPTRMYSCAYFAREEMNLEEAQHAKVDYLLRKLRLEPGMTVLDIGCGWGYLAVAAAKQYGAKVLGITLSSEQLRGAQELAKREGVEHLVQFELTNYQDLKGRKFDRVISVGMFEHVGKGNRDQYFAAVKRLLVPGGVSVLHTITQRQPRLVDAWVDRYVFPGGYLPLVSEIEEGLERHGFWSVDRENLWWHYAETLKWWRNNHRRNRQAIVDMFDERFYRMRDLWLAGSEGGFRHGQLGLTQVVFVNGKPADSTWPRTREYLYN